MAAAPRRPLSQCDSGAAAVEAALVLPVFVTLTVGFIAACLMMYSNVSLHYAVEQAARCYSVNAAQCSSLSSAQTYAKQQYKGIGKPTFTASRAACGSQVTASLTFVLNAVVHQWKVPLTAKACFP